MDSSERKETWSSGSYDEIAPQYLPMAGHLVERAAVEAGDEVLDIGCGTGNVAITAARRGAAVTGVDVVPATLDQARENARIAGVTSGTESGGIDWREGDAIDLPFEDDRFDVTLSAIGHMYGDPPGATKRELLRVTRPGGYIGFTAWTPTGLYPFMAGVLMTYLDESDVPEFSEPPFLWGESDAVRGRLIDDVDTLAFETETVWYPASSSAAFYHEMARKSSVFVEFLDEVDDENRKPLRDEMIETVATYFDGRKNAVELEYLLTTAKR